MAQKLLPEPQAAWARVLPPGLFTWLKQLHARVNQNIQILWPQIDTTSADLADLGERSHQSLDNILPAVDTSTDTTQNRHISDSQAKAWEDHKDATSSVHGATGTLIGTSNTATTSSVGVVLQGAAVADLNQVIGGPSIAEVQAISDKIDELLASLRAAGIINT